MLGSCRTPLRDAKEACCTAPGNCPSSLRPPDLRFLRSNALQDLDRRRVVAFPDVSTNPRLDLADPPI